MSGAPTFLGPFEILGSLGKGGMGVVYRARHRETGQLAAVKTVRVRNAPMLASLRREIATLARIRHPGIVQVLGEGVADGYPWFAMELAEGEGLRAYLNRLRAQRKADEAPIDNEETSRVTEVELDLPTEDLKQLDDGSAWLKPRGACPPEALREIFTVHRRLCHALAYLHGEGVVHRDLKPDNVLVREGGRPLLVDFGLTGRFGGEIHRESLQQSGEVLGTVWYMAPEQIRAELGDARIDLYALGCMLYEAIVGEPPFTGRTPVDVMMRHLSREPVPPSERVTGLGKGIDELLLGLLAKDAGKRIGHADFVAARLEDLGADRDEAPVPHRPVLYRASLAGRKEVVATLDGALKDLDTGHGGLLLVGGEGGAGKTRLLMEAAALAAARDLRVLLGEAGAEPGAALGALKRPLQTIGDQCRDLGNWAAVFGRRGGLLALYEPSLADLGEEAPPPLPTDDALVRLYTFLTQTFSAYAEHGLVLVLDDLHAADDLTLGYLEHLAGGALAAVPVLVLGAYRTDDCPDRLRALARQVRELRLPAMDGVAISEIVAGMLAMDPPPERLCRMLGDRAGGNPLFVAEYLRVAVAEGLLRKDGAGRWRLAASPRAGLELPGTLRELMTHRVKSLPAPLAAVAEAAALVGGEIHEGLVTTVSAMDEGTVLAALSQLVERQILEERSPGRLTFTHDTLATLLYERIASDPKREMHRRAAEALVRSGVSPERLGELGRHFHGAGDRPRARASYLDAAAAAEALYHNGEAVRLFRECLALCEGPSVERARVRRLLAERLRYMGRPGEAIDVLRHGLGEARSLGDLEEEVEDLDTLGRCLSLLGKSDEALEVFEKAHELATSMGDLRLQHMSLTGLANVASTEGNVARAEKLFLTILDADAAREHHRAATLSNLAGLRKLQGRLDEAIALDRESLSLYRAEGHRPGEAVVLANLGSSLRTMGRLAEAETMYRDALRIAREIGDRRSEGNCVSHLAVLLGDLGRFPEALSQHGEALAIHRETGNRRFETATLTSISNLLREDGFFDEAMALCEKALELNKEMKDAALQGYVLTCLACCLQQKGRIEEARDQFTTAAALHREADVQVFLAADLRCLGNLLRQTSDDLEAPVRVLSDAEAILEATGDPLERAKLACAKGHLDLAAGRSAERELRAAREIFAVTGHGPGSILDRAIARLARAEEAASRGVTLLRGELPEDLPGGPCTTQDQFAE